MNTAENLTYLTKFAPKYTHMPCAWDDKRHDYFTPREVSRLVSWLTRGELTRRRNEGLEPNFKIISGCIMYQQTDVLKFLAANTQSEIEGEQAAASVDQVAAPEYRYQAGSR